MVSEPLKHFESALGLELLNDIFMLQTNQQDLVLVLCLMRHKGGSVIFAVGTPDGQAVSSCSSVSGADHLATSDIDSTRLKSSSDHTSAESSTREIKDKGSGDARK